MIGIRSTCTRGLILVAALFFVGCGSDKTTSTGETKPAAAEAEAQAQTQAEVEERRQEYHSRLHELTGSGSAQQENTQMP